MITAAQGQTLYGIVNRIENDASGLRDLMITLRDPNTQERERTEASDTALQEFELLCSEVRAFASALKVTSALPE